MGKEEMEREREAFAPTLPLSHMTRLLRLQMEACTKYFCDTFKNYALVLRRPNKDRPN